MVSPFSFSVPTTMNDQLENLYNIHGVDRAVILDLTTVFETSDTIRGGYCKAYMSFFETCGLSFPISELVLEILAILELSFI